MPSYRLDDLIELAARAAAADDSTSARPSAESASAMPARRPGCIPMSRLADAGRGMIELSGGDTAHLATCASCAARHRAFALRMAATVAPVPAYSLRLRLIRAIPLAAAAALAFFLLPPLQHPVAQPRNRPVIAGSAGVGSPLSVRYTPHAGEAGVEPRVDCFQSTAHEPCVMIALFRTWNSACQCLMWELHRWEDGATLAEVAPGESVDVPLDVAGSPPVQQLFVVAVARERRDLPGSQADTERLLECLNHSAPPLGASDDAVASTSAVTACLPTRVTVVPAAFVPR